MINLFKTSIEQGLIFGVLAMGVMITYKILDTADLTVEGSFSLGAFTFAKFVILGLNPYLSTFLSFTFGILAGGITSFLYLKLKIKPLLSGILTMTMLYSINLRLNGKANIALFNQQTLFTDASPIFLTLAIALIIKILLDLFLKTEIGYLLIATGDNENLVKSLGKNSDLFKALGLMLSNGLVALSGSLMAQYQGFADITMGNAIIVTALASVIIGDSIRKNSSFLKLTTRSILGACAYKIIGGIAIDLGLNPTDLRAISAIIVILFISYNNFESKLNIKNLKSKIGGAKYVGNKKVAKEL
ncbi:MAG: ABC transporter permease [Tissierellales bacterium]|nr:ABC transporter permease [Tissierellales bacterium]